jgi:hypothetical protein
MQLFLHVRGNEVELDAEEENFSKVHHRIQVAKQARADYVLGNGDDFYTSVPGTEKKSDRGTLVFKLDGGGKCFFDTDDVFGVSQVGASEDD